MLGGHSQLLAVDDEIMATLMEFKPTIEEKAGKTFIMFEPCKYTKQVVAGMIYHVKIYVGTEHIHVKVFVPLPHTGEPPMCQALVEGQTEESEMSF